MEPRALAWNKGGLCRTVYGSQHEHFSQVIAFQSILAKEMKSSMENESQASYTSMVIVVIFSCVSICFSSLINLTEEPG